MKSKRGLSHVEMILSFVIFFSFLMFVYIYLVPHLKIIPDYASLNNAEKQITTYLEMKVEFFSLALNVTLDNKDDCFYVGNLGEGNTLVKDKDGATMKSALSGEQLRIEHLGNVDYDFYYVYFSPDFPVSEELDTCKKGLAPGEYGVGSKRSESWISFEKLKQLEESYKTDYAGLKETLGIKQDFAFSLSTSAGEVLIKADREKPVKNVLAKESVVKIYNENNAGNEIENGVLTILVW